MLGLADAALVAEHCDGLMLLVSLNRVDRSLPKESVARIRSSGAPLLGIVTNALKPENQSAAYGYGSYGYAYETSAAYAYYANDEDDSQPSENEDSTKAVKTRKHRSLQPSSNGDGKAGDKAPNLRDRWRAQRQQLMMAGQLMQRPVISALLVLVDQLAIGQPSPNATSIACTTQASAASLACAPPTKQLHPQAVSSAQPLCSPTTVPDVCPAWMN